MNQPAMRFTPWRIMGKLDFAHAFDDGLPEITERGKRFYGDDGFVEHLPDDRQLHECACAALARHKTVGEADQLKKAVLPAGDADFDIDPRVDFGREKLGGDAVDLSTGFFRALRNTGHHSAVAARAHCESALRQAVPESARFFVVGLPWSRPRAAKHGDDSFFDHFSREPRSMRTCPMP